MDPTVDPRAKSFVPVAADSHFPLQNLPYGVFSPRGHDTPRVGVRIGDMVLDLAVIQDDGLLDEAELPDGVFACPWLNPFMGLPVPQRRLVRDRLHRLLNVDEPTLRDDRDLRARALRPLAACDLHMPVGVPDYTDFYSSREHATNVGIMFRGAENALMPNWLHLPVGYHGRASSLVVSGQPVIRPQGQTQPVEGAPPVFGPSRLLDFELEMGFFIGAGNPLGEPVPVGRAYEHIFGLVLVNDWSARDIQKWEYQPLGPFNAKNFATSVSPWVVTLEALAPFRCDAPGQDPAPLPYLTESDRHTYDIRLEVHLHAAGELSSRRICTSNFRHLYWTMAQQLAHHTITGCNLNTGDLLASGTISGPDADSYGSLLELTWRGTKPLLTAEGAERRFLADGDGVTMTAWCQGDGYRVGFGEVTGTILPARPLPLPGR